MRLGIAVEHHRPEHVQRQGDRPSCGGGGGQSSCGVIARPSLDLIRDDDQSGQRHERRQPAFMRLVSGHDGAGTFPAFELLVYLDDDPAVLVEGDGWAGRIFNFAYFGPLHERAPPYCSVNRRHHSACAMGSVSPRGGTRKVLVLPPTRIRTGWAWSPLLRRACATS